MLEEQPSAPPESRWAAFANSDALKYVLLAAAVIYVIASLYLMYDLRTQHHGAGAEAAGAGDGAGRSGQAHSCYFVGV